MKLNLLTLPLLAAGLTLTSPAQAQDADDALRTVLYEQSLMVQSRYKARHPYETLSFFGLEPGMTVVEGLPGGIDLRHVEFLQRGGHHLDHQLGALAQLGDIGRVIQRRIQSQLHAVLDRQQFPHE